MATARPIIATALILSWLIERALDAYADNNALDLRILKGIGYWASRFLSLTSGSSDEAAVLLAARARVRLSAFIVAAFAVAFALASPKTPFDEMIAG